MPKADVAATKAKHFKDPGSFVFKDGREWLEREDWDDRKFELMQRARGRCEYIIPADGEDWPGFRCARDGDHPHHVILRSIARDDRMANLQLVCAHHHRVLDAAQRKQRGKYLTKPLTTEQILGMEPRES